MKLQTACPEIARLQDVLDGVLPEEEQDELTRHLDECPRCQQRLEVLAAGTQPWAGVTHLRQRPTQSEPGLGRAIAELKRALTGENESDGIRAARAEDSSPPEREPILEFLTPSREPGRLGRFGPYEVLEVIGRGGNGVVLKALDPALNRLAAIKVMAPQLAASAAARQRFAREAKAAAAVSHDHVVPIYTVDSFCGLPYFVMQYVPGLSLQQRLDRDGPLELEEVLRIAMQTAEGLAAAHAQGVVHRDVKPGNILLENGVERVKLTDFGLARAADDATVTQSGFLPGTPAYMAPEQARGDSVDHRADLFSLGSVVYAMGAGRAPFRASTTLALLRRVGEDTPRPLREINPRVPQWLETIMTRLHAKDPAQRFQSAAEAAAVFAACLAHVQQPAQNPLPRWLLEAECEQTRQGERGMLTPRFLQRWAGRLAASVLCLVLAVVAAIVIRVRTAEGTLVIEANDPSVKVTVDGQEVVISGEGFAEVRLRPGRHKVEASKDGKPVLTKLVDIRRDGREVVTVMLEPPGEKPAEARGLPLTPVAPTTVAEHKGRVTLLRFSPDGSRLASAGADRTVVLWDGASGKVVAKITTGQPAAALAFTSNGKMLVTIDVGGTLRLWDAVTGKGIADLKLPGTFKVSALSPDTKVLASASGQTVRLWDVETGKEVRSLKAGKGEVRSLAFDPDGKRLLSASGDGVVRIWDVESGKETVRLSRNDGEVVGLAFSPDGRSLVVGSKDGVRVWDASTGKLVRIVPNEATARAFAVSPDGKLLALAGPNGSVQVFRLDTGELLFNLWDGWGKQSRITCLAFSPDGKRLAWGTEGGAVKITPIAGGKPGR